MSNFDLYKEWIEGHFERINKEKKKQPQVDLPKEKQKKIELSFSGAKFLGEDWGKEIHEKVQAKYGKFEAISKIVYHEKEKIVKGTTPFYVVAVNEFLPEGMRTATQADLEKILKGNILKLEGNWEDSALVWRSNQEPNEYLANDVYSQFKARGITLNEGTPYVIPLFSLKLREDTQSEHKLAFDLTDVTLKNYFEAPILNSPSQLKFESSDIDEDTGLPKKASEKGSRKLYTRTCYNIINSGLVGLFLGTYLDLDSGSGYLAYSSESGRVVCISVQD